MMAYTAKLHDIRDSEAFDPNLQTVLSAHITVRGSELPTLFRLTEQEDVVFSELDLPSEFAYIALGHIHKPQFLNGRLNVRYSGSIERMDLGESRDDKGVVLFDLTPDGLAAEPRVLPLDATPIYDVIVRSPQTDIPDLQKRYPDAKRDLVRLEVTYTAGVDNREDTLRQLEAIFPRWYDRTITESGTLGPTLVIGEAARTKSFEDTVRDYLTQELTNHTEVLRDAVLVRAEALLREVQA
jgi:exonuclease SbcD